MKTTTVVVVVATVVCLTTIDSGSTAIVSERVSARASKLFCVFYASPLLSRAVKVVWYGSGALVVSPRSLLCAKESEL